MYSNSTLATSSWRQRHLAATSHKLSSAVATALLTIGTIGLLSSPANAGSAQASDAGSPAHWFVQIAGEPVAAQVGSAKQRGRSLDAREQRAARGELRRRQAPVKTGLEASGAEVLSTHTDALNGIVVTIDAAGVDALRSLPGVVDVQPLGVFTLDLDRTVPYVGASAVQNLRLDGRGVRVAVIDAGIDYTHAALGGPGTAEAFAAAIGNPSSRDGMFPTSKVIDGYDFLDDDDDPIDRHTHGTHVADIIAGSKGVAPGAALYSLRVCANGSCYGVPILNAIEWSLDPNGDGDLADRTDVINLSLGSTYGSPGNPIAIAAANAAKAGVVVVASAGNSGNVVGIVGSPSVGTEVISVAQTKVPSNPVALTITEPFAASGSYSNTSTLSWAPLDGRLEGEVVSVGRGCQFPWVNPTDPYLADPRGKIALIQSGTCSWGMKIGRAAAAGAIGVLIEYEQDPVEFPGDPLFPDVVPSLVISRTAGHAIRTATGPVFAVVDPSVTSPHVASMQSTSSRGPVYSDGTIKPDLGAPGASVSAVAGTGTGTGAFGGTSGAAPMVAGAAALLLEAFPDSQPAEIKARLMGTADTKVLTGLDTGLAPIARIGAGELRADRALATTLYALDAVHGTPSLSFGRVAPAIKTSFRGNLVVHNLQRQDRKLRVEVVHRYALDRDSGVVVASAREALPIRAGATGRVQLNLTVDPSLLATAGLSDREFDGYVRIVDEYDSTQVITVPWLITVLNPSAP